MVLKSFRMGGIHPPESKLTANKRIETLEVPKEVRIPLIQHIGAPAKSIVKKGDKVKVGQLIARAEGFVSSNVHSSVSGEVIAVENYPDISGVQRPMIAIEVEGDSWESTIKLGVSPIKEIVESAEQIVKKIAEAGVVGLGGATFPTHVKLSPTKGKEIDTLLINGAECEPYLTGDHRIMLEHGEEVVVGIRLLAKALGAKRVCIGIENNKRDAIDHLRKLTQGDGMITVKGLRVKYPQGGEKQLIAAMTGREVPSGELPMSVGVMVQNVSTTLAVYEAVRGSKPLIDRIVTVTGSELKNPQNLRVRIGTPIREVIEHCGGVPEGTGKVVSGGPMMGRAISNLDAPVTKGSSGLVVIPMKGAKRREEQVCIKCGSCINVCPMGLQPYMLIKLAKKGMYEQMENFHPRDCMECGSCSYICPTALPLLDYIKIGKSELAKITRTTK